MEKEKLSFLLKLIKEINAAEKDMDWFWEELLKIKGDDFPNTGIEHKKIGIISDNVDSIHRYLALDVIPIIDYDSIEDKRVRDQLHSDCIEMGRHRLGKRNHKIDFEEFGKYAHLQSEELVNYYYGKKFGDDLLAINNDIHSYNNKYDYDPNKLKQLGSIDYSIKLIALVNKLAISSQSSYVLHKLKNLRNKYSHRCSIIQSSEDQLLTNYYKRGLNKDNDWKNLSAEDKSLKNEAELIIFTRESNFDKIYLALDELKAGIIESLQ
jgi:hypothetical protein